MNSIGPTQKKILLALLGGVSLGLSRNPNQYYRTLRQINKEWKNINQQNFNQSIRRLSREKFVEEKILSNGSFKLILTKEGKKQAKILNWNSSINFKKTKKWDKKWRIVIFDIPEKDRIFRNILRNHLYNLDFKKIQQSVFVSPYPFEKSIMELVNIYSAEKYVRVITATKIDNEKYIKNKFCKLKRYF